MGEIKIDAPVVEEAAVAIKEKGTYKKSLNSQGVAAIMGGVVKGLLSGQQSVVASVPLMNVRIEDERGKIKGKVQVRSPITAEIGIDCILGNSREPGKLKLESLRVNQKAGFIARMALGAADIEGKARRTLRDPNKALLKALGDQLKPKGVKLTGIDLNFENDKLNVALDGESA